MTEKQAKALEVKARTQLSPYLEKCCLLVSANASYERTRQDILVLTGLKVSRGTQQRLVHRQTFELPIVEDTVEEVSIDGEKFAFAPHKERFAVGKTTKPLICTNTIGKPSCNPMKSLWAG